MLVCQFRHFPTLAANSHASGIPMLSGLVCQFRHFPGLGHDVAKLIIGDPPRDRTENLLIKSQLLYQLS